MSQLLLLSPRVLWGRRRSNKRTGTPESLWPGFEGVEDSHHHQQQPLGGGRRKGLATKGQIWSDTFNQALEEAGGNYSFFQYFDKIKLHQYFNILICLSLLGELRGNRPLSSISGHITHKGSSYWAGKLAICGSILDLWSQTCRGLAPEGC